jgi:hypothetical protein
MKYLKTIVCFANSRKTAGRCLAGKEWNNSTAGAWVRPVSARSSHEISEEERRYDNGRTAQILDIISIPCERHEPVSHQQENHLIDPEYHWTKKGCLSWNNIHQFIDNPANLWGLGEGSYAGINNRVAVGQENGTSLYLVSVPRLTLLVGRKAPEYPDSKRAVRGEFMYRNQTYRMDVTDPVIEQDYLNRADGSYNVEQPVLCVSLGDPYQASGATQSYYYKLIAAVLYQERFE